MAVSVSQTIQGRIAFRANFLPLLLSLCLALLWWGWRQRFRGGGAWWRIALAGVCAGLLPYTYFPARLTPFLFLFFGLSFVRPLGSVTWKRVRAELPWLGLFLGVAGLVAAPILVHFALHPDHLFIRVAVKSWLLDPNQGSISASLSGQCVEASVGLWFSWRPELAAQLRWPAYAEPMGSVLFLAWCGYGRVALAKATRLSSAPPLAGRADPAGNAGFRYPPPPTLYA